MILHMTSVGNTANPTRSSSFACGVSPRRYAVPVRVGNVVIGGDHPIVVQSMTNTDTADVEKTTNQIKDLFNAGSEIVRIAVDRAEAASAVPEIHNRLEQKGLYIPIVGDFHYNGHELLEKYPACAESLAKYRINPGNVGFRKKKDFQFSTIIEHALRYDKPVRIGVNWGSLDQELLSSLMDKNKEENFPLSSQEVLHEAIIQSALTSAGRAIELGLQKNKIVISAKVSKVQELVSIYTKLAQRSDYALHLGLTEAGTGLTGLVSSSGAMGILLQQGIGDTIRYSLTPKPDGDRTKEVRAAQTLLQSMSLRSFFPNISSCPGCGRTSSTVFLKLAMEVEEHVRKLMPEWRFKYPGVEQLNIAVMGCIVNGPGESKHADIGISLPGTGENPMAPVFIDGEKVTTLHGKNIGEQFKALVETYIDKRFAKTSSANLERAVE